MSDYPNSGAVYVNEKKEKETHPDRTGSLDTTCPHCEADTAWWVSGWLKKGKSGPFLSLAVKPKEARAEGSAKAGKAVAKADGPDDDIPF